MTEQEYIDLNIRLLSAIRESDLVLAYGYVERLNAHFGPDHPTVQQFRRLIADALETKKGAGSSKGEASSSEEDDDDSTSTDDSSSSSSSEEEEVVRNNTAPATHQQRVVTLGDALRSSSASIVRPGSSSGRGSAAAVSTGPQKKALGTLSEKELAEIDAEMDRMMADVQTQVKHLTKK